MNRLIQNILDKNYEAANASLNEELSGIVERKLHEKKKIIAAKIDEQIVHRDGKVHLATGEKVLPSVYRQRRGLAEENLEKDNEKVEAALAKARMILEPKVDTKAPGINRRKVVVPKGRRPADRFTGTEEGPREDEWEAGHLKEGRMKEIATAKAEAKRLKRRSVLVMDKSTRGLGSKRVVKKIDKSEYDPQKHDLAAE